MEKCQTQRRSFLPLLHEATQERFCLHVRAFQTETRERK